MPFAGWTIVVGLLAEWTFPHRVYTVICLHPWTIGCDCTHPEEAPFDTRHTPGIPPPRLVLLESCLFLVVVVVVVVFVWLPLVVVPFPLGLGRILCISKDRPFCGVSRVPIFCSNEKAKEINARAKQTKYKHVDSHTFFEKAEPINRLRRQTLQSKFPAHLSVTTGVAIVSVLVGYVPQ